MDSNCRRCNISVMPLVSGSTGLLLLLVASISASWIKGNIQPTYSKNTTGGIVVTVNKTGSSIEGIWTICKHEEIVSVTVGPISGSSNKTTDRCWLRSKSDLPTKNFGRFQALQGFYTLGVAMTAGGLVMLYLIRFVKKLQSARYLREINIVLFIVAGLLIMVTLIIVSGRYPSLTDLINPERYWAMSVATVADIAIYITAILCIVWLVKLRSQSDGYERI